ncbi:hypothetical protein Ccrd_024396 [Cynara cardunculus var. scolymus]|uniref:Uncharacterized protein n=1 Tax=Cynara cardunculus var. scolymus TaxID=59895 RepID=A0A103XCI3_CYNCS|nr:hypothetical protein Ccrd_024396 [Cynara cardunculus var. scolymus]
MVGESDGDDHRGRKLRTGDDHSVLNRRRRRWSPNHWSGNNRVRRRRWRRLEETVSDENEGEMEDVMET